MEDLRREIRVLDEEAEKAGRDPSSFEGGQRVDLGAMDKVIEAVESYRRLGFT